MWGSGNPPNFDLVCWWQRCSSIRWLCIIRGFQNPKFCYYSNSWALLAKLPDLLHHSSIFVSLVPTFDLNLFFWKQHAWCLDVWRFLNDFFSRITPEEGLGVLEVSAHHHLRWAAKGAYFWNSLAERVLGLIMHVKIKVNIFFTRYSGTQWVVC